VILSLFDIMVHNAFVLWLAKFSKSPQNLNQLRLEICKILRGKEGS
jgi:hypothetical protein